MWESFGSWKCKSSRSEAWPWRNQAHSHKQTADPPTYSKPPSLAFPLALEAIFGQLEKAEGETGQRGDGGEDCWLCSGCVPPFSAFESEQRQNGELRRLLVRPSGLMRCGVSPGESRSSLKLRRSAPPLPQCNAPKPLPLHHIFTSHHLRWV